MRNKKKYFNKLKQIKKFILDILFPIECIGCGQEGVWLCKKCEKKININTEDLCPVCRKNSIYGKTHPWCSNKTYLDGLIVASERKNKILPLIIHRLKYNFIKELAEPLSNILIKKIIQIDGKETQPNWVRLLLNQNLIVMPVPLHKRRLRWRGFNQADILAKKICQKLNLTLRNYILIRKKYTTPQVKLKRKKRLTNLQGVFAIDKEWQHKIANTKVLLVDDVTTTGATLSECARVLKKYGVLEVWGIVLERG